LEHKRTAEASDNFGAAIVAGNFNGDQADDLAIGVPNEEPTTGSASNTGEVDVLYGGARIGLRVTDAPAWEQDMVPGHRETGDQFGRALAAGDFNGDSKDDLAVGSPSEDFERSNGAIDEHVGTINVIYGSAGAGLTQTTGVAVMVPELWHQDTVDGGSEIEETAEPDDRFGSALAAGDFDGDGDDDLAVGVPGESVGTILRAGAVNVIYGSASEGLDASGDELFHQDRSGIDEDAEKNDSFGLTLTAWNFGKGDEDDLAVGVTSESGSVFLGGLVHAIYGDAGSGLTSSGSQLWSQDSEGVPDALESKDTFGSAFARD
jgi:hypothetical protein